MRKFVKIALRVLGKYYGAKDVYWPAEKYWKCGNRRSSAEKILPGREILRNVHVMIHFVIYKQWRDLIKSGVY